MFYTDVEAVEGLCVFSMSRYSLSKTTKQRSGKLCKDVVMNVGDELSPKEWSFVCGDMDCEGTTFKHPRETLRQNGVVKYVEYSFERLRATLQQNKMWRAGLVDHGDSSCALPRETLQQNKILSFDVVDFGNHSLGIPVKLHKKTKLISENLPLCLDERPCKSTTF